MDKNAKFQVATKKHLALISPLDWGLGHTTRCIPIIKELLSTGISVVIACDSSQKSLLIREFPEIGYITFKGYGLRYGHTRIGTLFRLFLQIPKILISVNRENLQLQRMINTVKPDFIISDNRYGFRSQRVPSFFITHQLNIRSGAGTLPDRIIRGLTWSWINRFTECWIPDFRDADRLAGKLSCTAPGLRIRLQYLGPLSRFEPCAGGGRGNFVLIILSGPEPQRSRLEKIITDQAAGINRQFILVRGLPADEQIPPAMPNVEIINFADSQRLNQLICDAGVVVCRPGYTSVMDLAKLQKKAVFIPTPGQGEQEYLAKHIGEKKLAIIARQESLDLEAALKETSKLQPLKVSMQHYKQVIREVVNRIKLSS